MVDFNNEVTIGTPAVEVVKILLLQARANVLEVLENYNKKESQSIQTDQGLLKARLGTWYLEHQAYLNRVLTKEEDIKKWEEIARDILFNPKDLEQERIIEIITELNIVIDHLRINRIDTRKQYDRTNIETDNAENQLY